MLICINYSQYLANETSDLNSVMAEWSITALDKGVHCRLPWYNIISYYLYKYIDAYITCICCFFVVLVHAWLDMCILSWYGMPQNERVLASRNLDLLSSSWRWLRFVFTRFFGSLLRRGKHLWSRSLTTGSQSDSSRCFCKSRSVKKKDSQEFFQHHRLRTILKLLSHDVLMPWQAVKGCLLPVVWSSENQVILVQMLTNFQSTTYHTFVCWFEVKQTYWMNLSW